MTTRIINLTQHSASPEQLEAGVFDVTQSDWDRINSDSPWPTMADALTFDAIDDLATIWDRACALAAMAEFLEADCAMIGGAPFFMDALTKALRSAGVTPLYAFTQRVAVEKDGVKTSVFKHGGWVVAD